MGRVRRVAGAHRSVSVQRTRRVCCPAHLLPLCFCFHLLFFLFYFFQTIISSVVGLLRFDSLLLIYSTGFDEEKHMPPRPTYNTHTQKMQFGPFFFNDGRNSWPFPGTSWWWCAGQSSSRSSPFENERKQKGNFYFLFFGLFQASDSMQFLSTMSSSQPKKGSQYLDRHWKVDTNVLLILPPVKN